MMFVYESEDAEVAIGQQLELELSARVHLQCATLCKAFCHSAFDALWWRLDKALC